VYRKLVLIHAVACVLLLVTWFAGAAIKTAVGTPFVALYYVLHVFPGSIIFILILFEWLLRNQGSLATVLPQEMVNKALHRAYYLILLVLPVTGIAIFFDWTALRLVYLFHAAVFYLLIVLVLVNILHTAVTKFRN
jgi:cytochrome b561